MSNILTQACDISMPRRKAYRRHHEPTFWWNERISDARNVCLHARRRYQRARGRPDFYARQAEYKTARRLLKFEIQVSKREYFLQLCDSAEHDPWGKAYKTVVKAIYAGRQHAPSSATELKLVVETLFPTIPSHQVVEVAVPNQSVTASIEAVTVSELLTVARTIKPNKAPGPDGIPNRAIKLAVFLQPDAFVQVFNSCLAEKTFPSIWKLQSLVVLPKPGKPLDDPSSYRPICLLSTLGKVLEKLICTRLVVAITEGGGLAPNQYGFRKASSTIDAISKVTTIAS